MPLSCFVALLPWYTNQRPIGDVWLSMERWNAFHSSTSWAWPSRFRRQSLPWFANQRPITQPPEPSLASEAGAHLGCNVILRWTGSWILFFLSCLGFSRLFQPLFFFLDSCFLKFFPEHFRYLARASNSINSELFQLFKRK